MAGGVVDDRVVAIAHTYAITPLHADIGVYTAEEHRNQGLSTACAALVAESVQRCGRTPTWSTGEDNWASMRVAEKLGYTPAGRRTYIIPLADR